MSGIRIKSNNFNGKSVDITFNPFSGGTINLGTQTIPYDYVSSNNEGDYSIYIPEFNKTCPLRVGIPPSPTPSASITPTPSITVTPTPTPSSSTPATDPDADAYLATILVSGGTTDPTIESAVQTLFTELKSNGLYSKMLAMYPFVGATAASHSINALLNTTYDITWFGGMSHGISGSTGNGTNAYGNTHFVQSDFIPDDISFGIYQTTENTPVKSQELLIGGPTTNTLNITIGTNFGSTNYFLRAGNLGTAVQVANSGNIDGFYIGSRTTTTNVAYYRNGNTTPITTQSATYTLGSPDYDLFLFNMSFGSIPYSDGYANQTLAFAFFGTGLSASENATLSTIINTFQTSLGRNTY
jgi:hypothetical protein